MQPLISMFIKYFNYIEMLIQQNYIYSKMGQNDPNRKNTGKKKLRIMIFKKSNFRFVLNASLQF